jgi:hypothetical protein
VARSSGGVRRGGGGSGRPVPRQPDGGGVPRQPGGGACLDDPAVVGFGGGGSRCACACVCVYVCVFVRVCVCVCAAAWVACGGDGQAGACGGDGRAWRAVATARWWGPRWPLRLFFKNKLRREKLWPLGAQAPRG